MKHLETLTIMALATLLMALAPATASAQSNMTKQEREGAVVVASVTGTVIGAVAGTFGGIYIGNRSCTDTGPLACVVPVLSGGALGLLVGTPLVASAMGAGVSSIHDPRRSSSHVLLGAGVGALVGVGGMVAATVPFNEPLFEDPSILALPVLTASTGALIGYFVPPDLSVSLVPTAGGASAHVGFTF